MCDVRLIDGPIHYTGYLKHTKAIMEGSKRLQKGYRYCVSLSVSISRAVRCICFFECKGYDYVICSIEEISELFIIGRPDMTIIAFGSKVLDIFEVNDIMSSKGWHLNALQRPNRLDSGVAHFLI